MFGVLVIYTGLTFIVQVDSDEVLVLTEQGSWEAPLAPVPTEKPQTPPSPETPSVRYLRSEVISSLSENLS
jgi:hypothetical protein